MKKIIVMVATVLVAATLFSQEGFIDNKKGGCKSYTSKTENRRNSWNGKCVSGLASGYGTLKVFDSDTLVYTYEGNLLQGKFEGQGTMTWADGDKYVGQWKDGNYEGYGVLNYTSKGGLKNRYEGYFKENKFDGDGILNLGNGEKFKGHFANNEREGFGIEYDSIGKIEQEGYWDGYSFAGKTIAEVKENALKAIKNSQQSNSNNMQMEKIKSCEIILDDEEHKREGTFGIDMFDRNGEVWIYENDKKLKTVGFRYTYTNRANWVRIDDGDEIGGSGTSQDEAFNKLTRHCGCSGFSPVKIKDIN